MEGMEMPTLHGHEGESRIRLAIVELRECHLRVGVNKGLLIDTAHPPPFKRSNVEGVLRSTVARTFGLEFTVVSAIRALPESRTPARFA